MEWYLHSVNPLFYWMHFWKIVYWVASLQPLHRTQSILTFNWYRIVSYFKCIVISICNHVVWIKNTALHDVKHVAKYVHCLLTLTKFLYQFISCLHSGILLWITVSFHNRQYLFTELIMPLFSPVISITVSKSYLCLLVIIWCLIVISQLYTTQINRHGAI